MKKALFATGLKMGTILGLLDMTYVNNKAICITIKFPSQLSHKKVPRLLNVTRASIQSSYHEQSNQYSINRKITDSMAIEEQKASRINGLRSKIISF